MTAIPLQKIEGKYEILEKLREGGMGAIYKVRHCLLDEVRVIKVMRPQLVQDEELKGRFLREARMAIKLRHPNIAQLYDFTVDEEDGTAFIVMEFINGMTLEEVLKATGPPPLGLALEIAHQSLRALGYLHGKGMIHRDISPDNLMLAEGHDGEPLVKLIDLGIAKSLAGGEGQRTATGMFLGKVRYASPEQFGMDGAPPMSARGDLYSFGLVLYELLTGRYPIVGGDPSSIIAGHLFRPPLDFAESDPGGHLPAGLRKAMLWPLAKSPEERPPAAQELAQALAPFRTAAEPSRADLRRALSRPTGDTGTHEATASGSTQQRLNEHFGLVTTPTPTPLTLVPPPPPSPPAPPAVESKTEPAPKDEAQLARELADAIGAIEAALARGAHGDYRAAEALLYAAEASFGPQDAFPPLYDRVAELHRAEQAEQAAEAARRQAEEAARRQAEAAAEAQRKAEEERRAAEIAQAAEEADQMRARAERRARKLAAAVAEIQQRLERGDLQDASRLIDLATERFGSAEALREKWQLLETYRRKARATALVEEAESLVRLGNRESAELKLHQALEIDAGNEAARRFHERSAEPEATVPIRKPKAAALSEETRATIRPAAVALPEAALPDSPAPPVPSFESPAGAGRSDRRLQLVILAVLLALALVVGWLLSRPAAPAQNPPRESTPAAVQP